MDNIVNYIMLVVLIVLFWYLNQRSGAKKKRHKKPQETEPDLYLIANELDQYSEQAAHPMDIMKNDAFERGVEVLNSQDYSDKALLDYYQGTNPNIAWMALEALGRRPDTIDLLDPILEGINMGGFWTRYFALRTLHRKVEQPIIALVLLKIDDSWDSPLGMFILKEFIGKRINSGEKATFGAYIDILSENHSNFIEYILRKIGTELTEKLITELVEWRRGKIDLDFLRSFGKIWESKQIHESDPVVPHEDLLNDVRTLMTTLQKKPSRSVIVVGDAGVGKTCILRVLIAQLLQEGWLVFEAGGADILAGQIYVGELEKRLQTLMQNIAGKEKVLWVVPDFANLLWAGRHQHSPSGILDFMLSYVEKGEIVLIGESQLTSYERLIQMNPRIQIAFEVCRILPMNHGQALELAREWCRRESAPDGPAILADPVLAEAAQLTQQYLGDKALPGSLLRFLKVTTARLKTVRDSNHSLQIGLDDLLLTLAQMTGLPMAILDDRQNLDLQGLSEFFHRRVFGQPEAIAVLVERIAMIKAGLTDPGRPQGVFFFVGPTGTGKTEIAKSLAEFLFGSPERMIRLDMSEFQNYDTIDRIVGTSQESDHKLALVNLIRHQPFSVLLLDEFEKAHPGIWDLFLQVFDDGRLTDKHGNLADFRHSIIILTSNLGAHVSQLAGMGFGPDEQSFSQTGVTKAVHRAFSKEFINRIDRVVVFRPLSKKDMRDILHRELQLVLQRRGLRSRSWAVEWDDSALEFLLKEGFTPDLGARPLKRAIDRFLLSPLAMTIVNHQFPEGDQFLFVKSDGSKIQVEFIDPDDTEAIQGTERKLSQIAGTEEVRLQRIILDAHGNQAEFDFLKQHYDLLAALLQEDDWQQKKQAALDQMSDPAFWQSDERFAVLSRAEYMDRVEAGLETAGSFLERLASPEAERRKTYSKELLERTAQRLFLIEAAYNSFVAGEPQDAFLAIEVSREIGPGAALSNAFGQRLATMYRKWAQKRGMELTTLEERLGSSDEPYRLHAAVSGFAAFSLLKPESGLHVLQVLKSEKNYLRYKIRVRVLPQPTEAPTNEASALFNQAKKTFAVADETELKIVRSYRESPSPLVTDNIRKWRTGHLQRVLDGDFDVME